MARLTETKDVKYYDQEKHPQECAKQGFSRPYSHPCTPTRHERQRKKGHPTPPNRPLWNDGKAILRGQKGVDKAEKRLFGAAFACV